MLDGRATRRSLGERIDVEGLDLRPVEITGDPGDMVVAHIQVFHAPAPNATARPRQMIGNTVRRLGLRP